MEKEILCEGVTQVELYDQLRVGLQKILQVREKEEEVFNWDLCARENQKEPGGDWYCWLILAGRGFGKTRTGAETIRKWVNEGQCRRLALIGETQSDVRRVMVEGDSGLLSLYPREERPLYEPSKCQITWPNGTVAHLFSGDQPDQLRGPQFDGAWVDELAKFATPDQLWQQLQFSLRLGEKPRSIVTTTPRPISLLKKLLDEEEGGDVYVTRGSTFENADNLSTHFIAQVKKEFQGTRLGAQELYAEMVEEQEGALWSFALLEKQTIERKSVPDLSRIIVAVDPAMTNTEKSDETGIIVAGLGEDENVYILDDYSGRYSATQWSQKVVKVYHDYGADRVVAEVNQGGDLVEQLLRVADPTVSYKPLNATVGKRQRAEPVVALYEQGRVFHIRGSLKILEDQMTHFVSGQKKSPDRMDALVWAVTELALKRRKVHVWRT